MAERQPLPNRQSHRYAGYDYSSAGAYFVTVCVWRGRSLLGEIRHGEMILNAAGRAIEACWLALPERFLTIGLDAFQVMPNHFHGVLWLQADPSVGALLAAPDSTSSLDAPTGAASSAPTQVVLKPTLGQVMRTLKSKSAIEINRILGRSGRFWQRDYYDRIIRDEQELANIRQYISTNPIRWEKDQLHPNAPPNRWNQWIE